MKKIMYSHINGVNGYRGHYFGGGRDDGNYPQGTLTIVFDDGCAVIIEDTSCGDFGTRVQVSVMPDVYSRYYAYYGTMEGEVYSTIPGYCVDYLVAAYREFGYSIPLANEIVYEELDESQDTHD